MPGRMHSREFKLEVLEQIESKQKSTAQVCREHQLAPSLIYRWRKELEIRGQAAFTDEKTADQALERRIAELERYCGQLALENTILKSHWRTTAPGAARDDDGCASRASRTHGGSPV